MLTDADKRKPLAERLRLENEEALLAKPVIPDDPSTKGMTNDQIVLRIKSGYYDTGENTMFRPDVDQREKEKRKEEERTERLINFFRTGASLGDIVYAVSTFADTLAEGLRAPFASSARQNNTASARDRSRIIFEDDYAVTIATQLAIEEDQAFLTKKFNEFQAIDTEAAGYVPGTKMRAGRAFVGMMEEFNMLRHPKQKELFVASIEKVEELEALHRKPGVECTGTVCVFRHAATPSVDSRGIKVKIGDQYDQKPVEAIASGDHLKGAHPAPAPHLS